MTIYQCRLTTGEIHYADTEQEAIAFLQKNGGGIYRNTLHNFDCPIKAK